MVDWTQTLWDIRSVSAPAAALFVFALAIWVLWVAPSSRLHRGVFVLLLFMAARWFLSGLSTSIGALTFHFWFYAVMAVPFAALYVAFEFVARFGVKGRRWPNRARPWVVGALLIAAASSWLAYMLNHDLLWDAEFRSGPFVWFIDAGYLAFVGVAIAVAWEATRVPPSLQRRALHVASLGFLILPSYVLTDFLMSAHRFRIDGSLPFHDLMSLVVLPIIGFLLIGILLARTITEAMRLYQPHLWRQARDVGLTVLIPAALAITWNVMYETSAKDLRAGRLVSATGFLTQDILMLTTTGLLAFAVLRCNLLRIEFNAKRVLTGSALTAGSAFIYFLGTEGLDFGLAQTDIGSQQWLGSIVAAGIIAIVLLPLLRGARLLADRLLPGVDDSNRYWHDRGRTIYEATLDVAWRDGEITPRERAAIERLGANLGLSMAQMREIEDTHQGPAYIAG